MTILALELGALVALLTGLWGQISAFATWLSGWLIERHRLDYSAAPPLLAYLRATASRHRISAMGVHGSELEYVQALDRTHRIFYVHSDKSSQWFLAGRRGGPGRRPIWYTFRGGESGTSHEPSSSDSAHLLVVSFLRGTVDWPGLLAAVASWEADVVDRSRRQRVLVQRWFGRGGQESGNDPLSARPAESLHDRVLIGWQPEDLGRAPGDLLAALSLTDEQREVVAEVRRWRESRAWYAARGVTWRRGYLLEGPPGTGKTALVRALGQLLGCWINVIDVASMTSRELADAWAKRHSTDGLSIVVLEDFDCVFDGREPVPGVELAYDAVLQVLDGVEQADGVLLFVTANHPERLDPALLRPGRIDRRVTFGPIGRDGLRAIARRILDDDGPEPMPDETPAAYQERCVRLAITRRFA